MTEAQFSHEQAYYAGLFDGEGSVGIYMQGANTSGKKYPILTVKITNTYKDVFYRLDKLFGGNIDNNRASLKHSNWQDAYTWRVYSEKAHNFLCWIQPFSRIKQAQIIIANAYWLEFIDSKQNKYDPKDMLRVQVYIDNLKQLKRGK